MTVAWSDVPIFNLLDIWGEEIQALKAVVVKQANVP